MSLRLKNKLVRTVSKLSLDERICPDSTGNFDLQNKKESEPEPTSVTDDEEEDEEGEPKKIWKVMITGGAGHLAICLVEKILEMAERDIAEGVKSDSEEHFERILPFFEHLDRVRKLEKTKKEDIISTRISDYLQIILIDLADPEEGSLNPFCAFAQGSFADENFMKPLLENVTTIFHLAAVGMTGRFARDRESCMQINSVGTMNLLSWARDKGVKQFIYTSSVGVVFGGEPLINFKESDRDHTENFFNFYCESKAHAENIVRQASYENMKTSVLRFSGIYGVGEKRVTERVINFMKTGWWIAVFKSNGVEAQTQLSSVDNCVQGLIKAELALRHKDSKNGQIYNIVDRNPVGTFSFWAPVDQALGFPKQKLTLPPIVLRVLARFVQSSSDFFGVEPFFTVFEVELLLVTTTFSTARAVRELGYDPYPSAIPAICRRYASSEASATFEQERAGRANNFLKKMALIVLVGHAVLYISYFFVCYILLAIYYIVHAIGYCLWASIQVFFAAIHFFWRCISTFFY
ncbi:hypothetical protein GCK72_001777 [Caenorhabditis remanei]|uniref:3-beta hydroxysteroid dehydrogenase/isomerase domain-containing protein n=1 Tax=Caenorhabditis remanei TaxID=31234 RepID=A0A6A5HP03_CAERE|nr:hypothetical protein GCK72_001777 [Caenorhabditis remanei]KAF1769960.1 hypothetical protein GCK72_001777 [Caenorhabditis remanei]